MILEKASARLLHGWIRLDSVTVKRKLGVAGRTAYDEPLPWFIAARYRAEHMPSVNDGFLPRRRFLRRGLQRLWDSRVRGRVGAACQTDFVALAQSVAIDAAAADASGWRLRRRRASSLDDGFVGKGPVAGAPVKNALAIQFRDWPLGAAVRA
jgi:hypothetical protein